MCKVFLGFSVFPCTYFTTNRQLCLAPQGFSIYSVHIIYIDATGAADAIDNFLAMAKSGATLSIVGVHHAPRTINLIPVTYGGLTIKGSPGYDFEDVARAMEIMKSGKYDIESLVSHTFPLEQLEEAIQTAAVSGASEKVLIEY